jgi:hypothetical protein
MLDNLETILEKPEKERKKRKSEGNQDKPRKKATRSLFILIF